MQFNLELSRTLNRLCKWRTVFSGWQLGTRAKGDPESDAVSHHREATIMLRIEVSALIGLLIKNKLFSLDELHTQLIEEATALGEEYEKFFPGFSATETGMKMTMPQARETMNKRNWRD